MSELNVEAYGMGSRDHIREYAVVECINPLKTERRPLYLKAQFVPRSKHFSSQL